LTRILQFGAVPRTE